MEYPDEVLKESQISLKNFVTLAGLLYSSGETDAFLRFVLAGRFGEGKQTRIFLNACQGASPPEIGKYEVKSDIDSIVGVSSDLPYNVAMAIFPLPSFRDTLTENNHLIYQSSLCPVRFLNRTRARMLNTLLGSERRISPQNSKRGIGENGPASYHTPMFPPYVSERSQPCDPFRYPSGHI